MLLLRIETHRRNFGGWFYLNFQTHGMEGRHEFPTQFQLDLMLIDLARGTGVIIHATTSAPRAARGLKRPLEGIRG
jgi:hypothetical protein